MRDLDGNKLVNYVDWSDRGYERYEGGEGNDHYAECDLLIDDKGPAEVTVYLMRNSRTRRHFTLFIPLERVRALLEEYDN
jgi:hypothetical protein